jgi:hypothetical protein
MTPKNYSINGNAEQRHHEDDRQDEIPGYRKNTTYFQQKYTRGDLRRLPETSQLNSWI